MHGGKAPVGQRGAAIVGFALTALSSPTGSGSHEVNGWVTASAQAAAVATARPARAGSAWRGASCAQVDAQRLGLGDQVVARAGVRAQDDAALHVVGMDWLRTLAAAIHPLV